MTQLITIQGSARGGKGTLARALTEDLSSDHKVYKIDQGLKFRILAVAALDAGIDVENLDALAEFVTRGSTRIIVNEKLLVATAFDKNQLEKAYYSPEVSNASGMVGKLSEAQVLVVELLKDQVRSIAPSYDIIIVDGRAMRGKGKELAAEGVVEYLLAVDVHCDAFVSAQRETKIFAPQDENELAGYSHQQALDLLVATRDIARRNSSDARRSKYPSLPLHGAYEFDVLHEMTEAEWRQAVDMTRQNGAISVDNSATRTPEQLTAPVVRLVRSLVNQPEK